MKIRIRNPIRVCIDAQDPEHELNSGDYVVAPHPSGAGYGGRIEQTHWELEKDGKTTFVPATTFEQQIRCSSEVEII